MSDVERIKEMVFSKLQESGAYRHMQSELKAQVLSIMESQSQANKNKVGFSYQHPLLKKLLKYDLSTNHEAYQIPIVVAHICLDLIQQFLEAFQFEYTLSVFKKQVTIQTQNSKNKNKTVSNRQVNRTNKINREVLSTKLNIQNNGKPPLVNVVSIIVKSPEAAKQLASDRPATATGSTFSKTQNKADSQQKNTNANANIVKQPAAAASTTSKDPKGQNSTNTLANQPKKLDSEDQASVSASFDKPVEPKKPQKPEKPKKDESAGAFLAGILQKQIPTTKKPDVRAHSAPPTVKTKQAPPPETGANKIKGNLGAITGQSTKPSAISALLGNKAPSMVAPGTGIIGRMTGFGNTSTSVNKDPYAFDLKKAMTGPPPKFKREDSEEDQFVQSKDSTRRNPLYSSTEDAMFQSGNYDQSVDSVAIQEYDYVENAKAKKKR